ncbi:bifunctional glycosyltransferase family 2/GtrA family protein [Candidatus Parcubacteria bacterium]|nr:bifunctional glycosyltransferase family 2/GtrA family protein [Candidatus Parcubacteria bacterium]
MSKTPIRVSIFFPAYNEEQNLTATILRAVEMAENSPFISDYEIIIINDGSTDRTLDIAYELEARYPKVRTVNHATNQGYGAALKSGIATARMEYVFFTDADLQFDIMEVNNLLLQVPQYGAVIGYRAPRRDPFIRLLNAKVWNLLNRLLFGLRVRDIDCAFKIFKRDLIQNLPLQAEGAMISAETLIRLKRAGVTLKEVPVSHLPRKAGSPTGASPAVIMRAFKEMMILYSGELGLAGNKEVLKFMSVGVVNTLLDASTYLLLTRTIGVFAMEPTVAKFFSFMFGTISSLMLNRYWTFGIRSPLTVREVARFYATVSLSLAINVSLMFFFVEVLHVYDLVALVLVTGLTFAVNYTLSKV